MKVVVFGGNGFLGSHVTDALVDHGHEVIIYDIKPVSHQNGRYRMVTGDILDELRVFEVVKDCDVVYNFAGIADIAEAAKNPLASIKTNILGTATVLEACRMAKVKRFVFASTLYVYSNAGSFYRSTKQACELLVENYNEVYGIPYTILRYGSLYGPRADHRNFVYRIVKQALTEGRIIREGDGEEIREYIHVVDAARYSVEILSEDFVNQYVIITGNQQTRVKDLLIMIKEMLGGSVKIEFLPPRENYHYEITPYSFSPKMAKRLVGNTYLDLGQGILKCMEEIYRQINPSLPITHGFVIKNASEE